MNPCPASRPPLWRNLILVATYATAMGLLEAICVVYLRRLLGIHGGNQVDVAAMDQYYAIESWREACTIVMLIAVGWLAGTTLVTRFGFFVAAFGIWDVWYYIGLFAWAGWPASIMEWDCLFLLPCPWYGPVLAPVLISLSFVVSCVCLIVAEHSGRGIRPTWFRMGLVTLGWTVWILSFIVPSLGLREGHAESYPWWALVFGMIPALAATWPLHVYREASLPPS